MNVTAALIVLLPFLAAVLLLYGTEMPVSYGWEFGEFVAGDVFEYDVCDRYTLDVRTGLREKCFDLRLYTIGRFGLDIGPVWLLYVTAVTDDDTAIVQDIAIVDETLGVETIRHRYVKESLGNTVFWMPLHAGMTDIELDVGGTVQGVPGVIDNYVVTDFVRESESIRYTLSSDSGDSVVLRDDLYLPLSAKVDSDFAQFDINLTSTYNTLDHSGSNHNADTDDVSAVDGTVAAILADVDGIEFVPRDDDTDITEDIDVVGVINAVNPPVDDTPRDTIPNDVNAVNPPVDDTPRDTIPNDINAVNPPVDDTPRDTIPNDVNAESVLVDDDTPRDTNTDVTLIPTNSTLTMAEEPAHPIPPDNVTVIAPVIPVAPAPDHISQFIDWFSESFSHVSDWLSDSISYLTELVA